MFRIFTFFTFIASIAGAAELRLSVDGAADYAIRNNPTLAAARLRIDEARGRLRQAGRLSNPELEVDLSRNVRAPEGSWGVALVQKFPLTARLHLEKMVSVAELDAARAEVYNEERKLAGEVRALAVKLVAQREQRTLRDKQIAHSKELSGYMTKRVESGEASALDVAQVQLETQQLDAEALLLESERVALITELRPLLGTRAGVEITGKLTSPGKLPGSGSSAASRADYLAAQAQIRAAEQSVELARAGKWEDAGVGLGVSRERSEDAPEGFETDTMLALKFSLPLPFWNKNEGRIAEAKATVERTRKEADALAANIRAESDGARGEMAALAKIVVKLDDELIPAAQRIEEQFRTNYGTGQVALPEVLRARTKRLELERQRLDALRDYHLARARHTTATTVAPAAKPLKKTK